MKKSLAVVALFLALPMVAFAAKPAVRSATLTVKTTIEAIDHTARTVTFKDKDGYVETVHVGPEVKRFDELKVGDTVTFSYSVSIVVKLQKPGEPGAATSTEPTIERGTGARPEGKITQQETATVLIKSIDPKVPAVTVETGDGSVLSFQVADKNLLKNVKAGDRVDITYTEALMISVQDSASPSPGK